MVVGLSGELRQVIAPDPRARRSSRPTQGLAIPTCCQAPCALRVAGVAHAILGRASRESLMGLDPQP